MHERFDSNGFQSLIRKNYHPEVRRARMIPNYNRYGCFLEKMILLSAKPRIRTFFLLPSVPLDSLPVALAICNNKKKTSVE
jgi:hypothetical protein